MSLVSRTSLVVLPALFTALACGGGSSSSGHSTVPAETELAATTATDKQEICSAHMEYFLSKVNSVDFYCRIQGQNGATGTTDAELQITCALEEEECRANGEAAFADFQANYRASCDGSDPFVNTLLREYATCPTTVGSLEDCGIESIDTLAGLRDVSCSEYTVALRNVINSDYSGSACDAIRCQ